MIKILKYQERDYSLDAARRIAISLNQFLDISDIEYSKSPIRILDIPDIDANNRPSFESRGLRYLAFLREKIVAAATYYRDDKDNSYSFHSVERFIGPDVREIIGWESAFDAANEASSDDCALDIVEFPEIFLSFVRISNESGNDIYIDVADLRKYNIFEMIELAKTRKKLLSSIWGKYRDLIFHETPENTLDMDTHTPTDPKPPGQ
ncbi:hypothetical protein [Nitrospirillum viridazoti]|uniref:Uncharacterized protein n=1 Tax=Nitrospirillum amazonense TaxID=28077 RepID=A0A560IAU2_9PROT|nr:hypothetical protein [Nitrospirillum amazonense]TWB56133.1 hypothetical protein FBZ92_113127 [Nitrospirillum amazonense]